MNKKVQLQPYILLFFLASICGWFWELLMRGWMDGVTMSLTDILLHFRGVLHGPWVPLYGCGVLVLAALQFFFKKHRLLLVFLSIACCGILEYVTGYILETLFHQKYWDYTGFFLNVQGRICFISVFGFGIVGAAFAIFLLPRYLKLFENMSGRLLSKISLSLTLLFAVDSIYSIARLLVQR